MEYKTPEEMDAAADLAEVEIQSIFASGSLCSAGEVAYWWKRWYMDAGHKRLGRILLKHAS